MVVVVSSYFFCIQPLKLITGAWQWTSKCVRVVVCYIRVIMCVCDRWLLSSCYSSFSFVFFRLPSFFFFLLTCPFFCFFFFFLLSFSIFLLSLLFIPMVQIIKAKQNCVPAKTKKLAAVWMCYLAIKVVMSNFSHLGQLADVNLNGNVSCSLYSHRHDFIRQCLLLSVFL